MGAPTARANAQHTAAAAACAILGATALWGLGDLRASAPAAVLILLVWGSAVVWLRPAAGSLSQLVICALLVRLPLVLAAPTLSDDIYRYLWEGHVWAVGENPFVDAPSSAALMPFRTDLWALVNHREVSSVYPPLAQLLFLLLHGAGVVGWKGVMAGFDIGIAVVLARRSPASGWLWALLPLPAVEAAGSGHLEAAGVLAVVLAFAGRPWGAWVGAMVKLLPVFLLFPALGRRYRDWIIVTLATLVVMLPLLWAGPDLWRGFERYRQEWSYNGSFYWLGEQLLGDTSARRWLQIFGALVALTILWRSQEPARIALWVFGAFVAFSPTVHPWYVLWPLAAALWNGMRAWTLLAVLIPASYIVLGSYDETTSRWTEPLWVRPLIYVPFYLSLLAESWRRLTRAGPAPVW